MIEKCSTKLAILKDLSIHKVDDEKVVEQFKDIILYLVCLEKVSDEEFKVSIYNVESEKLIHTYQLKTKTIHEVLKNRCLKA